MIAYIIRVGSELERPNRRLFSYQCALTCDCTPFPPLYNHSHKYDVSRLLQVRYDDFMVNMTHARSLTVFSVHLLAKKFQSWVASMVLNDTQDNGSVSPASLPPTTFSMRSLRRFGVYRYDTHTHIPMRENS